MVNEWRYSVSELSKSIAIERCDSRFAVICRRSCLADRPRVKSAAASKPPPLAPRLSVEEVQLPAHRLSVMRRS